MSEDLRDRIVDAALRVERLRCIVDALREARNTTYCELAEPHYAVEVPDDVDPIAFDYPEPVEEYPCWKRRRWVSVGHGDADYRLQPESQWCRSCQARQRLHDALREYTPVLGGARGQLTRLTRQYLEALDEEAA